jgi:rubrerythrin
MTPEPAEVVVKEKREMNTPGEILQAALGKEKEAYQFYSDLLARRPVEIVRELVEKLKNEEHRHIRMVEGMITKLHLGKDIV